MKLLFWNTNKRPLVEEIAELISERDCCIYAFAEVSEETIDNVVILLNERYDIACAQYDTPGCERIRLIVRISTTKVSLLNQHKYYSLIKVKISNQFIIVGFVHFPSKYSHSHDEIRRASELLCSNIAIEEERYGIDESIVIGDFNVDPFEMPMISFTGMGATNGIACSKRGVVTRSEERRKLFYNPMWVLYSKNKERPGSFKYSRLGEDVVSWHFLDQVVIRPSLIESFDFESLELIEGSENFNYLNRNMAPALSDHIPLTCQLITKTG